MKITEILVWLGIFIVGSLIVTFLISPNSFQTFKYNIKEIIPEQKAINNQDSLINDVDDIDNVRNVGISKDTIKKPLLIMRTYAEGCYNTEDYKMLRERLCRNICSGVTSNPEYLEKYYYKSYNCGGINNRDLICYCEE